MAATDFKCPVCDAREGSVCRDANGLSRWGRPHQQRAKLHTAALRERHQSERLYVRVHALANGADVDYSTDDPAGDKGMLLYTHMKPYRRSYTATDTQRRQWIQMRAQGVACMSWEARVEYRIYTLAELHAEHGYAIVYSQLTGDTQHYRVINLSTGDESALYKLDECREIIRNAAAIALQGSFA